MTGRRTILILALLTPALVWPQPSGDWRRQLVACLEVPESAARLSCLEAVARQVADSPTVSVVAETARGRPSTPASAVEDDPVTASAPVTVEAAVLHARQRARGQWLLELDNGQTWTELQRGRVRFRPGMVVRIEPGFTGSHLLTTEEGSVVRVRPVDGGG